MANIVVAAIAKWNGSALVKGEKQLTQFQKTTNKLAKSFITLFAAQKIYAFGKASVKAFAADEKAAKSLEIALKNTGNGFATIATEGFISRLQDTYKVLDDELRPAFQTLLQATSSITESQKALELALSISAGTGKDLGSVSMALAKGFAGQTTALSRLGAGLSKATLASGDMDKIMAELSQKFAGQALAATKTYTGQMAALTVASESAKEEIGQGLLDSIALLGGSDGIQTATDNMENLGKATADTLYLFASLVKTFNDTNLSKIFGLSVFAQISKLSQLGSQMRGDATGKGVAYSPTSMYFTMETAERAKLVNTIKKQNTTEKEKQKLSAAELKDKKKQAELDELKKKFDVDRINLETALANSTDDAEKARIKSLLTIIDEDENAAAKRMAELDKSNAAKMQAEYFAAISLNNLAEAARLAAMGVRSVTLGGAPIQNFQASAVDPSTGIANPVLAQAVAIEADIAAQFAEEAAKIAEQVAANSERVLDEYITTITGLRTQVPGSTMGGVNNFTINTPLGSEEALTEAVQRVIQKLNRMGDNLSYAGALP
jgi:hypothetical protein